jgi:glucose-6-phosphate-specific signal transduction histidine kinase
VKRGHRSFDPRHHWQQTQVRLLVAGLALVGIVGGGLVWLLYGSTAAITTWLCLVGGTLVLGLLWLVLGLLERWVKEDEP